MSLTRATLLVVVFCCAACAQLAAGRPLIQPILQVDSTPAIKPLSACTGEALQDKSSHVQSCSTTDQQRLDAGLPVNCIRAAMQQSGELMHSKAPTWFKKMLSTAAMWPAVQSMTGVPGSSAILDSAEVLSATSGASAPGPPEVKIKCSPPAAGLASDPAAAATGRKMLSSLHQVPYLPSFKQQLSATGDLWYIAQEAADIEDHVPDRAQVSPGTPVAHEVTARRQLLQPYELLPKSGGRVSRSGATGLAGVQDSLYDGNRGRRVRTRRVSFRSDIHHNDDGSVDGG